MATNPKPFIELGMPAELAKVVARAIDSAVEAATVPATQVTVAGFTTAGSTVIAAGTAQEVIEAVADLADPAP